MNLAQLQSGTKKQPANQKNPNKQTNNTLPAPNKKRNPKQTLKKKEKLPKKVAIVVFNYRFISNKSFSIDNDTTARQLLFYWLQVTYQKMLWCFYYVPWYTRIRWSVNNQNWPPSHFSCTQNRQLLLATGITKYKWYRENQTIVTKTENSWY